MDPLHSLSICQMIRMMCFKKQRLGLHPPVDLFECLLSLPYHNNLLLGAAVGTEGPHSSAQEYAP